MEYHRRMMKKALTYFLLLIIFLNTLHHFAVFAREEESGMYVLGVTIHGGFGRIENTPQGTKN